MVKQDSKTQQRSRMECW